MAARTHSHAQDTALVAVVPHVGGGAFSRNAAAWEVQAELDKPDNRAKLQIPGATRSELFVWLDAGDGQAALSTLAMPPFDQTLTDVPVLNLPPGNTGAWMASGLAAWPRPVATLFYCDGHHWQKTEPPELDYNDARLEAMLTRVSYRELHLSWPPLFPAFQLTAAGPGKPSRLRPGPSVPCPWPEDRPPAATRLASHPPSYPTAKPGIAHSDERSVRRWIKSTYIADSAREVIS
jgi:hypothetical protein